jgi:hypothetical protein
MAFRILETMVLLPSHSTLYFLVTMSVAALADRKEVVPLWKVGEDRAGGTPRLFSSISGCPHASHVHVEVSRSAKQGAYGAASRAKDRALIMMSKMKGQKCLPTKKPTRKPTKRPTAGECSAGVTLCTQGQFAACRNSLCHCARDVEGQNQCVDPSAGPGGCGSANCTASSDCAANQRCISFEPSCCEGSICTPLCAL